MSIKITSASLSPNPVAAGGSFTLSVGLQELAQSHIPWRGYAGAFLADSRSNSLYVANTNPSLTAYQSRWREDQIDALLGAWISQS